MRSFEKIFCCFAKFWQFLLFFSWFFDNVCIFFVIFFWEICNFFALFWLEVPAFCDLYAKFVFISPSFDETCGTFVIFWWNLLFLRNILTKLTFLRSFDEICSYFTILWQNSWFFSWNLHLFLILGQICSIFKFNLGTERLKF